MTFCTTNILLPFFRLIHSVVSYRVLEVKVNKEKTLQLFFVKGENASQAAVIVNDVYGPDAVTSN